MIDVLWILLCAGLVFLMQPGFACLESGLTRSKNSINVAIKNFTDMVVAILLFWAFGYGLMFGPSISGFIGRPEAAAAMQPTAAAAFLFQAMFCATSATIVSGAVAERMKYGSYIIATAFISAFLYPIFGHWAWGANGWLRGLGFVDFAGSTVVHSVGGWVALAAVLRIGPRRGLFESDQKIQGHDLPVAILGAFLLFLGWFGFNGGSSLRFGPAVPGTILNTVLGGLSGSAGALAIGWPLRRRAEVDLVINGALAGLVAITAGCDRFGTGTAMLVGLFGGALMVGATALLERWKIDDAVGAFPVHGAAGVLGTLAVAFVPNAGVAVTDQLAIQAVGVVAGCAFAFGLSYLFFGILDRVLPLRVSPEEEKLGLNIAEHGATTELVDLFRAMDQAGLGNLNLRVPVEPFTEVGQIAQKYNHLMEALASSTREKDLILGSVNEGLFVTNKEGQIGRSHSTSLGEIFRSANLAGSNFSALMHSLLPPSNRRGLDDFLELLFRPETSEDELRLLSPLKSVSIQLAQPDGRFEERNLRFRFRRIESDGKISEILWVVSDETEQVQSMNALAAADRRRQAEMEKIFSILHVDPPLLVEFLESARKEWRTIDARLRLSGDLSSLVTDVFASVHAAKGNADVLGLSYVATYLHEFEESLLKLRQANSLQAKDLLPVAISLHKFGDLIDETEGLVARLIDFQRAVRDTRAADDATLLAVVRTVERLAAREGKEIVVNHAKYDSRSVPSELRAPLRDVLVQLARNSVTHGIEHPRERVERQKPSRGEIVIATRTLEDVCSVYFRDDGRGLDVDRIRERAKAANAAPEEELMRWGPARLAKLIFLPGLSSRSESTMEAGRGMGMSVVRRKVAEMRGRIRTSFAPGRFCQFEIMLPIAAARGGGEA